MKKSYVLGAAVALAVIVVGCAREVSEDSRAAEQRYLDAYNQVYYQGRLVPTTSGLYYINTVNGTGTMYPADDQFAFIRYTTRSLTGTIDQTSSDSLAKQLGIYSDSLYYGPTLVNFGTYNMYLGLEEVLKGMTAGGYAQFIMPSWLSPYIEGGSKSYNSPMIMDVSMVEVIPDILKWQTDTLGHFRDKRFPGLDSTAYDFFYKEIVAGVGDTATSVNDTMCISYVGYLLDGFVFDTNIADTATKYGIYNSSITYGPMEIIKGEMSFVDGFTKALKLMNDNCEVVTFFSSGYGYGAETKGQIPRYAPLIFHIKLQIKRETATP